MSNELLKPQTKFEDMGYSKEQLEKLEKISPSPFKLDLGVTTRWPMTRQNQPSSEKENS